jgi:hypothetical protein
MRLLLLTLLVACSSTKHEPQATINLLGDVKAKRDRYIEYAKSMQDEYGWLPSKCDGLLFNSLAAFSGFPVNPLMAEETSGRFRRHPDFSDCKPGSGAKSTISKDMFRGLWLWLWQQQDVDTFHRIYEYGDLNDWVMGEAEDDESFYGRVLLTPAMIFELKKMIDALELKLTGIVWNSLEETFLRDSYAAHLHILNIYAEAQINGKTDDVKTLKSYAEREPRNALFQALYHKFSDGDQTAAINILMDESLFPADRLPTSADNYCSHYLWQRDMDEKDIAGFEYWKPCPHEGQTHPGIDLMLVAKIIEGEK